MGRKLDDALDRLQRIAGVGAPFAVRTGAEARYADAYQEEVRADTKPQIGAKYRRGNTGKRMAGGGTGQGKGQSKGQPHPSVHGFHRNGYRVEAKWNPREKDTPSREDAK